MVVGSKMSLNVDQNNLLLSSVITSISSYGHTDLYIFPHNIDLRGHSLFQKLSNFIKTPLFWSKVVFKNFIHSSPTE